MTERRDYVGLDWVAGEIAESLQAAQDALQAFIDEPNDSTRLHFCLAHIHQVQGSLQMVEFFGVALLAEEMELLVNAVLDGEIADNHLADALLALKRSLGEMPRYLEKVRESHREFPSELVLAFNELRAVRGQNLLATADLFAPDIAAGTHTAESPVNLPEQEFLEVAKKLRQMYQVALLGYFKGVESRKNLNYMAKVCARAAKICRGHKVQDLWVVCIALLEGLLNNSIHSGFAVRNLLRRVDKEIRLFVDAGQAVLERPLPETLLRDMLFYVATSNATSNYVRDVKARYKTADALPSRDTESRGDVAMAKVREALAIELGYLANALARNDFGEGAELRLRDVHHALAILGLGGEYQVLGNIRQRIERAADIGASPEAELRQLADALRETEPASVAKPMFNGSEEAQQQLDRAYLSVIRESRNGLELAKEAVVNFVANQWHIDYLKELPELLSSIQGSLFIAELGRAARILRSSQRFVSEQLLDDPHTPDWQTLDALADSLTSVDYYLERCASDFDNVDHDLLLVAERCVAQLGYPVDGVARPESEAAGNRQPAPSQPDVAAVPPAADAETDEIDPELIEIFVEEADEVLDTLNEYRPSLANDLTDSEALGEIRRGFHTLKGSGRMVGALQIGELAWSIENMLNRVVEKHLKMDGARLDLLDQCIAMLPDLISAFGQGQRIDATNIAEVQAKAEALSNSQSPDLSALVVSVPVLQEEPETAPADDSEGDVENAGTADTDIAAEGSDESAGEASDDTQEDALADIFVAEARIHLQVVENFLARAEAPIDISDAVQRSLHTLKGAANMAEMFSIAELISPLEKFVKELRALRVTADVDSLMLLRDVTSTINQAIDHLESGEMLVIANSEVLQGRIDALHRRLLLNVREDDRLSETLAPGELDSFMVETADRLTAMSHTLTHYADGPSLRRLAETSGLIAQRASEIKNLEAISELALGLKELMARAIDPLPEEAVELCRQATDAIDLMLNQLAAEQKPAPAETLLERIQNFDYTSALDDIEASSGDVIDWEDATVDDDSAVSSVDPKSADAEPPSADDEVSLAAETPEYQSADTQTQPTATSAEVTTDLPASLPEPELDEDVDPEVAAIFLEEAEELLEGIDESINAWSESDGSQSDLNNLLRHLHTIKGGARMAGLTALGSYTHEFESFVESSLGSGESNSDQFLPRLHLYQDALVAGVDAIRQGERFAAQLPPAEPPVLSDVFDPESELAKNSNPAPANAGLPPLAAVEPEVVEIFLEEADDLIEAIDDAIQYWTGDRSNTEHLELLQRHLHTFKGGARLAGLQGLGDTCHEFESYVEQTESRDDDFLSQMLAYQDRLTEGLSAIRGGNTHWASEPLLPAVAGDSARESLPQPTARADEAETGLSVGDGGAPATMDAQMPQEMVKVSAQLMENLVNLAGETSISRGRAEEQVAELTLSLDEMAMTVDRLQEQVRRLDIETEAQILFRQEQVGSEQEGFDPLEFDRYSQLQQLSRSLMESSSDLTDIRHTLGERTRDMETLLLQQGRINSELQEGLMRSRMVHFTRMIPRLRRIVRQVSLEIGKRVDFKVYNAEGELDRQVLERIIPPLEHMLRNAVDHGIETNEERRAAGKSPVGNVSMRFGREGGDVLITLTDDGAGIDFDAVRAKAVALGLITEEQTVTEGQLSEFLFEAGFSTASRVTQISGRGVGMDVVYSEIKQLGGGIEVESTRGKGTRFVIRLPFTVSVNRALMVSVGGDIFAVPINTVEGVVRVSPYELEVYYQPDAPPFEYANQSYSLRYMGGLLRTLMAPHLEGQTEARPVLLARGTDRPTAVQVDSILGSREIVVKALGPQFSHVHGLSGATVLGDGSVVVIVDIPALIRVDVQRGQDALLEQKTHQIEQRNRMVMVVDDSVTVRKVTSRLLERQGIDVMLAKDGVDAVTQLQTCEQLPDVILLDIEMPRMDGFEVASRVRHTGRLQDIPIIMITSRTGDKHRERAFSLGVNKYLGKPYQEITLLQAISEVMGEVVH